MREIVSLKYIDSNMSWEQQLTTIEPVEIEVAGFLIKETEDYITLAMELVHIENDIEYRNQVSIPKKAILERKT